MPTPDIAGDQEQARAEALDETVQSLEAEQDRIEDDDVNEGESGLQETAENSESGDDPDEDDIEIEEVDLSDDDLFAGVDDIDDDDGESESESDSESEATAGSMSEDVDSIGQFTGDNPTAQLQSHIEDGAAKLAVLGLEDDDQAALEDDLRDVFSAFRLGYYGAEFANEYIFVDGDGEVDPAWALLGSSLACAAVAVMMRPDSDDQIARLKDAVNFNGGGSA
ncbi:acyl-CoA dehydrogenase [Natrinema longum]|uniref:Acyl-CoA dehydrogenase n=1 Tax=Natrinema longum TaxID=370324 RepID=A0A8A2UBP2_9EURY|nr:acyl-CoA dehydrogenase [Natrinema longum]MBZ6496013.1 acyl-CoA dehydrogenase [Natrinema longum]QSW86057.1 acyl-CoA dehydrogenase [Natrinema longum]